MSYQYGQPRQANGHAHGPGYPPTNSGYPQQPQPLRQAQSNSQLSRAEAFDDEKKRIIASCFSKKDANGTLFQSYITHIRVEEDGGYPSEPPPANADPIHKKSRVIIAAVRLTGRVYLHKARENDDRTFQIGKTWPLEELQTIESFSPGQQKNAREQERARLAGDVGFIITIAKPYFWKAKTAKEKSFFIGSTVKIYRKFTGGKVPKLVGFDPREERDILTASEPPQRQSNAAPSPMPQQTQTAAPPGLPQPSRPYAQRPTGSDSSLPISESTVTATARRRRPSNVSTDPAPRSPSAASSGRQRPPSSDRHRDEIPPLQPSLYAGAVATPPTLKPKTSQDSYIRSRPSQEQPRLNRLETPPEAPPKLSQQNSRSNFSSPAPPQDRNDHRMPSSRYGSEAPDIFKEVPKSPNLATSPHDSYSISSATTERWKPAGASSRAASGGPPERQHTPNESIASNRSGPLQPPFSSNRSSDNLPSQSLPERRRPPLESSPFGGSRQEPIVEEDIPKPLRARTPKQSEQPPRPQVEETPSQLDARIPGSFRSPSPSRTPPPPLRTDLSPPKRPVIPNTLTNGSGRKSEDSKAVPPAQPQERAKSPPQGRKSEDSKPKVDVATPATARTSTPEPQEPKSEAATPEQSKPGLGPMFGKGKALNSNAMANWGKAKKAATAAKAFTPRAGGAGSRLRAEKSKPTGEPDGVTSVVPAPQTRAQGGHTIGERLSQDKKEEAPDVQITSASPKAESAITEAQSAMLPGGPGSPTIVQKPQKQMQYQYDNALLALGIEPSMLGGQGKEYEATLTEFGWAHSILQTRTMDGLEGDLRKEIARLEAGPWLGQDSQDGPVQDSGVVAFEKILDKTIAECDEMEKLLSLYGVELSVS